MFESIPQLVINALITGAIYGLVASGLTFIYATTRVFHLAHGVIVLFAAYVFWWLWNLLHVPYILAVMGACFVAIVIGLAMNEVVYEPLRRRGTKGLGYLIATIALLEFGTALLLAVFGSQPRLINLETPIYSFYGSEISLLQIVIVLLCIFLLGLLAYFIKWTRFGKAMRAIADQEVVAEVLGVDTRKIRRLTFAIGSLLGAVAGIMIALEYNLDPNMGISVAIKGFAAIVMGGPGSMAGALVGSIVLGTFEQGAAWFWGAGWKNAVAFILIFVFLITRPQGIFGRKKTM